MEEGYRYSPEDVRGPLAKLTAYDEFVGFVLRMAGFALICLAGAIAFGVVVPAPGFEEIGSGRTGLPGLIFAGLFLQFGGNSLRAEKSTEYFGKRDLLDCRLKALVGSVAAIFILYAMTN